jgi:hypothetical protein
MDGRESSGMVDWMYECLCRLMIEWMGDCDGR